MLRRRWRGGTAWSQLRRNGTTLISLGEDSTSSIHDNMQQYSSFILAGQPGFTAAHHFFGRAHFDTGKTFHGRLRKDRGSSIAVLSWRDNRALRQRRPADGATPSYARGQCVHAYPQRGRSRQCVYAYPTGGRSRGNTGAHDDGYTTLSGHCSTYGNAV